MILWIRSVVVVADVALVEDLGLPGDVEDGGEATRVPVADLLLDLQSVVLVASMSWSLALLCL